MSTAVADHDQDASHDIGYVKIAALLAVITGVEVALPYLADVSGAVLAVMLILMVVKFFFVVAWFMHLKDEGRLLTQVFVAGLVLASVVYFVMLTAFAWFSDSNGLNEGTERPPHVPALFDES